MTILALARKHAAARPASRLRAGWWLLPAIIGGAAGWVAMIWAVFG